MFAFEWIAREPVVEGCGIEPYNSKGLAKVFFVALRAGTRSKTCMVSGPRGNALAELRVTGKAPLARNRRFAEHMATDAFVHPLEFSVSGRKFPGRDLPVRWMRRREQNNESYHRSPHSPLTKSTDSQKQSRRLHEWRV
jgi:hypothetical protein